MRMLPPLIQAGALDSRVMALAIVLLPQPDSPASPKISPLPILKETSLTARNSPVEQVVDIELFDFQEIAGHRRASSSRLRARVSRHQRVGARTGAKLRIGDLVEGKVKQRRPRPVSAMPMAGTPTSHHAPTMIADAFWAL